jgi:signal transduction histidine kinase
LAATVPVPIDVSVDVIDADLSERIAACAWFVCAEALANVVKYAAAGQVRVAVTAKPGVVVVQIGDDGVGGADAARGSGLRGLADRVAAVGGTFIADSPAGAGTRLTAELPTGA